MPLVGHHWLGGASAFSDGLNGPPEGGKLAQWIGGVVFPVIIGVFAVFLLLRGGYVFSVFAGFLSTFVHFHYFWGLTKNYSGVSVIGKNGAALGMILCFGYGVYYFIFQM